MKGRNKCHERLLSVRKDPFRDEFYTPRNAVEKLVNQFKPDLKGKRVYCNCDGPQSEFYKVLKERYAELGLSGLTATGYGSNKKGHGVRFDGITEAEFSADGDFRKNISLLDGHDVVVTNPPFSLFKEYFKAVQGKDFILLAPVLFASYSSLTEPLAMFNSGRLFVNPSETDLLNPHTGKHAHAVTISSFRVRKPSLDFKEYAEKNYGTCEWKTNMQVPSEYRDVIAVRRTTDIPRYGGLMAVPVTALEKLDCDQVAVVGQTNHGSFGVQNGIALLPAPVVDGKIAFKKLVIRLKMNGGKR